MAPYKIKGTMYLPCEGAVFSGKHVSVHAWRHPAVSCAKMAEQIEMLFGFWTRGGPNEAMSMWPYVKLLWPLVWLL